MGVTAATAPAEKNWPQTGRSLREQTFVVRGQTMVHYNVWFSFDAGVDEGLQIARVRALLDDFQSRKMIANYRLLRNRGEEGKTKLPKFQAIVEFQDDEQFGLPFAEVAKVGVHLGSHGSIIQHVDAFVVEVFEQI
jgi:hypothetical protein